MRKLLITAMALAATAHISTAYAMEFDRARAVDQEQAGQQQSNMRRTDRTGNLRQKVNRIFNALDTDENEIITLSEFLVKTTKKAANQFDRIDTDDDELISREEFLAIGGDRNNNTDIDVDALRACVADQLGEDLVVRDDPDSRFDAIDTNDDGFIDFDEFLASRTEGATNRFNVIDADSDGGITKIELAQALMQHRERRVARRACAEDQQETDELLEG